MYSVFFTKTSFYLREERVWGGGGVGMGVEISVEGWERGETYISVQLGKQ